MLDSSSGFDAIKWAADRFALIGWTGLILLTWRISTWVKAAIDKAERATEQVDKLATEHFPAIKSSLQMQDGYLKSMSENLNIMADAVQYEYAAPARRKRRLPAPIKRQDLKG